MCDGKIRHVIGKLERKLALLGVSKFRNIQILKNGACFVI